MKSGSALVSPDQHKTELEGNPDFRRGTAYDSRGWALELDIEKLHWLPRGAEVGLKRCEIKESR